MKKIVRMGEGEFYSLVENTVRRLVTENFSRRGRSLNEGIMYDTNGNPVDDGLDDDDPYHDAREEFRQSMGIGEAPYNPNDMEGEWRRQARMDDEMRSMPDFEFEDDDEDPNRYFDMKKDFEDNTTPGMDPDTGETDLSSKWAQEDEMWGNKDLNDYLDNVDGEYARDRWVKGEDL